MLKRIIILGEVFALYSPVMVRLDLTMLCFMRAKL